MRHAFTSLAILAAATTLAAQSPQSPAYTTLEAQRSLFAQGCPVEFSAQRRSVTEIIQTKDGSSTPRTGQGLHLTFEQQQIRRIAETNITVHAYSTKPRLFPVSGEPAPDIAEDFHLSLSGEAANQLISNIWMNREGSIAWVELNDIVYANGTTWHKTDLSQCHATPNGFLLVNATAH